MEKLKQRHLRGNIRELRNAVERILVMTSGDSIDARDVPHEGPARPETAAQAGAVAAGAPPAAVPLELAWSHVPTLQEFKSVSERAYLVAKLRENGWNISKTAE